MQKLTFTTLAFFAFAASVVAQGPPFEMQSRCEDTDKGYASIRMEDGNIFHNPCPSRSSVFTGDVDFSNATIRTPFRLVDGSFLNFQGIDSYFSIGNDPSRPITIPEWGLYPANFELELRGDSNVVGLFSRMTTSTPSASSLTRASTYGVWGLATNPADTNTNRVLGGIRGTAYQRTALGSEAAYGGYFEAIEGGNLGGINPTPLYGVYAVVQGGHNGTSPLTVAGRFNVSNIGGGGVGNITEGIAVHAQFDGGFPTTNYVNAKGIALQGWGAANGGTYTNSYGIYADTSIDRGTANRYFIYSLSLSPSFFSGVVRVAQDVYVTDATKGLVLSSEDGSCYRFTVAKGGSLTAGAPIACP